jgi:hypothetical protein
MPAISNSMVSVAARNFDRDIGSGIDLDIFDEIEGQLPGTVQFINTVRRLAPTGGIELTMP